MDLIDELKRGLRHCARDKESCEGCVFEGDLDCVSKRSRESLKVIGLLEEQNKELRDANSRLEAKLEDARKLGQNGVPPMPCKVGDPLWAVLDDEGMISVTKTACKELLWNGESWLISEDDCCWDVPDEEVLFLSIEAAVKKAEEMLRKGNDGNET